MSWVNERVALVYGGVGSEASVSREGKEIVPPQCVLLASNRSKLISKMG